MFLNNKTHHFINFPHVVPNLFIFFPLKNIKDGILRKVSSQWSPYWVTKNLQNIFFRVPQKTKEQHEGEYILCLDE